MKEMDRDRINFIQNRKKRRDFARLASVREKQALDESNNTPRYSILRDGMTADLRKFMLKPKY